MVSNFKIIIVFLISIWMVAFVGPNQIEKNYIDHKVIVNHPGEKSDVEVILIETRDSTGLSQEYYMDVTSVICLEEVCKIIPVRLFWNNLGVYKRYELEQGATLEKYEADLFETEDYKKLHHILANTNSPFKEVYIDEILTVVDKLNTDDIDAVSGATALELDEKDTVPGAALTCYTLWHWANGNIIQNIKTITTKSASNEQLLYFLTNTNTAYFYLATEALKSRNIYQTKYMNSIYNQVLKNEKLLKNALNYLESAPIDIYLETLKKLLSNGDKEQKLAAIRSLNNSNKNIPKPFLDEVSSEFSNLTSFHEVSILLELMDNKNNDSQKIIKNLLPLLEGNFITARRVYWYLKDKKLTPRQQEKLNSFYTNYKNKL